MPLVYIIPHYQTHLLPFHKQYQSHSSLSAPQSELPMRRQLSVLHIPYSLHVYPLYSLVYLSVSKGKIRGISISYFFLFFFFSFYILISFRYPQRVGHGSSGLLRKFPAASAVRIAVLQNRIPQMDSQPKAFQRPSALAKAFGQLGNAYQPQTKKHSYLVCS